MDDIRMTAVAAGAFATTSVGGFNLGTMLVTRSFITHVGLLVKSADHRLWKYEALFEKGFVGPRPFQETLDWQRRRKWLRRVHIRWLPKLHGVPEAQSVRAKADRLVETTRGYGKSQLLAKWAHERLDWDMQHDPTLVDCSEGLTICLWDTPYRLVDEKRQIPDAVTPGSAWRKLNRILAAEAAFVG